jgi:RES domain-containing protein
MRLLAYRIALSRYSNRAFFGEGARKVGGRWNPRGTPAVYASATLSLAALEFLAHLNSVDDAPELVSFRIEFDSKLVTELKLPEVWRKLGLNSTRSLGRDWFTEAKSPILKVPSFIIPSESNFVLNPTHRAFSKIKVSPAEPFELDHRLF